MKSRLAGAVKVGKMSAICSASCARQLKVDNREGLWQIRYLYTQCLDGRSITPTLSLQQIGSTDGSQKGFSRRTGGSVHTRR
jgi:hypothetical protein